MPWFNLPPDSNRMFASPSFFLSDNILQYSTLKIKIVFAHLKMVKFKFIVNLKFALSLPYCHQQQEH